MKGDRSVLKGSLFLVFLFSLLVGWTGLFAAQPVQSSGSSQTVKGEVLIISEDLFVVKNEKGQGLALGLMKSTRVEKGVRVGDKVEATVTPDGTALSIKKSQ